jgi:hypothetical protein
MPEALTGTPRILNKIVDGFVGKSSGGTLSFDPAYPVGEGWDIIESQAGSEFNFRWRGYIDLGGLEREALTFFMQSAQVTENGALSLLPQQPTGDIEIVDIFSKVEISDDDLNLPTVNGLLYTPGYNDSVQDMEQVLWARLRNFYQDSGWSNTSLLMSNLQQIWGEGIGTSASRIHLTRYVAIPNTDYFRLPGACFQCVGTAIEEPDLEYIMRLRRDYELATQG